MHVYIAIKTFRQGKAGCHAFQPGMVNRTFEKLFSTCEHGPVAILQTSKNGRWLHRAFTEKFWRQKVYANEYMNDHIFELRRNMERQNCLMILLFIILGGYVIILSSYVIIFGD